MVRDARTEHDGMPRYHRKKTEASNAFTDLVRAVLRMSATAEKAGSRLTRGLDLSSARWQTLGVLQWSDQRLTASAIARRMGLSRQAVQHLVDEMAAVGLVAFEPNPNDRRAKHVVLTTEGRERHRKALDREWKWTNRIVEDVDAERIRAAVDLVTTLTEKMME